VNFGELALPAIVGIAAIIGVWSALTVLSQRNSRTEERLRSISQRPASLAEIEVPGRHSREEKLGGLKKAVENLGDVLRPQTELEASAIRIKLANAGFRSESAAAIYQGLRLGSLMFFTLLAVFLFLILKVPAPFGGEKMGPILWVVLLVCFGLYLPNIVLWFLRRQRQEAIFLTLPDALDLLVVCVESGLGLDAAMRKVTDEMKDHAKILCEELTLANFQLQMGRPRREVLHDLGVRTGVDDVRSLAAILIQADRFGSSIAQALRVQSDSMRTRRRQLAEEKAAKTAVQLIFPLVLFIFPGIFVVLVGPAAISIMKNMLKN